MSRKKTNEQFLRDAESSHPGLYDYLTPYQTAIRKIEIRCRRCGHKFKMTPNAHLNGQGCEACNRRDSRNGVRYSKDELLSKMSELHGWKYAYDLGDYRSVDDNITIICPEHGAYRATPSNHLRGKGCAKCAKYGFNPENPAYLYLLVAEFDRQPVVKVGITNNPKLRLLKNRNADGIAWILDCQMWYAKGRDALSREQILISKFGTPFLGKERFFMDHGLARRLFSEVAL